ncbi:MAG TPA: molecular chaperone Tir [Cyanobacteria bacterium UBA9273]|nr:molecular chaperone Tir [Cyanobacteria bacterium UBA9273]
MSWERVKNSTVAIANSQGIIRGTGFFISSQGHLLTCAHVVDAAGGWEQVRVQGQEVSLVYLGSSTSDDFAVLQLRGYGGEAVPLSLTFEPMDRFLSIGYGRSDFPEGASIDGVITDINPQGKFSKLPMLRLRVMADAQQVQAGYSGSPVFDAESQQVIGVMAAYDNKEGALAVPLTTVQEKWPTLGQLLAPQISTHLSSSQSRRVFISYRSQDPDLSLAQEFYEALKAAGHQPFMAGASIRLGEDWPQRIDRELAECDYFLLLLSSQSATSEMVTEEVRRARELRDRRPEAKPAILPIRVNFPLASPLNYDLRGYLQRIQQREWQSPADTGVILQEVLSLLSTGEAPAEAPVPAAAEVKAAPLVETLASPPLPVAEPELPGGQMELASQFYVQREPLESRCYQTIEKRAALIRIKAPRQMGKTSLLARIRHHAEQQGCRSVSLSFQQTDESVFRDLNQFLRRFCALVSRQLGISPKKVNEWWDDELFGPKDNCNDYFENCLLADLNTPLVLGLDEVDRVFPYNEVAKEFLTLLRAWNEQAKINTTWAKLRLVMVHSTEAYVVMDTNSSPFNVGLPIELPEFSPEQVMDLARRHGLAWGKPEIESIVQMVGGHPYLVRVALYYIAQKDMTLTTLLQQAPTESGPYGDHLRQHLWNLQQHPELLAAIRQAVMTTAPVRLESMLAFKLHGMGLVNLQGNDVTPRCDLYKLYFRDRLRVN